MLDISCMTIYRNSHDAINKVPRSTYTTLCYPPIVVMFGRISLCFIVVSLAAFFCTQPVAAKGPRITHHIYFDIKHGDQNLGRGKPSHLMTPSSLNDLLS
jgi:hypothetical protein